LVWSGTSGSGLSSPPAPHSTVAGIGMFLALGLLLQFAEHRLSVGPASGSIAFIVYLGSALVFGTTWGAAVTGVTLGLAQVLAKKRLLRIAFNVAQLVLAVVVATTVYTWLGGTVPPAWTAPPLLAFAGMVVVFITINSTAVSGVIALSESRPFDEVWLRNTWSWVGYDLVASTLALGIALLYQRYGVTGIAIVVVPILFLRHAYLVNVQLQATNRELLDLMVKAIEARDPYTSGHSQRVSQLARTLAMELGIHLLEADNIATAALLHDVGKIYEEFAPILRKEGRLTPEERAIMDSHPVRSAELVSTISSLRGYVEKCVRHHHENFDGSGYPDGIAGDAIPIGARIVLVADTTDAMTTDRPYRKALTYDRVVAELDRFAGKQFDPRVVAAFKRSVAVRRLVGAAPRSVEVPVFAPAERHGRLAARWTRRGEALGPSPASLPH
jgi:putative nucleotidyltransferase with HDIG domain